MEIGSNFYSRSYSYHSFPRYESLGEKIPIVRIAHFEQNQDKGKCPRGEIGKKNSRNDNIFPSKDFFFFRPRPSLSQQNFPWPVIIISFFCPGKWATDGQFPIFLTQLTHDLKGENYNLIFDLVRHFSFFLGTHTLWTQKKNKCLFKIETRIVVVCFSNLCLSLFLCHNCGESFVGISKHLLLLLHPQIKERKGILSPSISVPSLSRVTQQL